ncbi:hypothetical protein B296_00028650 [Ensete ventricosum]|uniref:Uncharacterized protein n=1 Tax=Ensete ventricosum TaxID=4639 RepID=A0A426XVZ7_ENSVE|nr:hypothetical protein B296_00028650 [Ensete ventricosum]
MGRTGTRLPSFCLNRVATRVRVRSPSIESKPLSPSTRKFSAPLGYADEKLRGNGGKPEMEQGRRIMIVVDSSPEAKAALLWGLSHSVQSNDTVVLVQVVKPSKHGKTLCGRRHGGLLRPERHMHGAGGQEEEQERRRLLDHHQAAQRFLALSMRLESKHEPPALTCMFAFVEGYPQYRFLFKPLESLFFISFTPCHLPVSYERRAAMEASMRKLKAKEAGEDLDLEQYVLGLIKEKLGDVLHLLEDFVRLVAREFDKAFPPETRSEALRWWRLLGLMVALPLVLVLVLVLVLLCLFSCCCRYQRPWRRMEVPTRDCGAHGPGSPRAPPQASLHQSWREEGPGVVESPLQTQKWLL